MALKDIIKASRKKIRLITLLTGCGGTSNADKAKELYSSIFIPADQLVEQGVSGDETRAYVDSIDAEKFNVVYKNNSDINVYLKDDDSVVNDPHVEIFIYNDVANPVELNSDAIDKDDWSDVTVSRDLNNENVTYDAWTNKDGSVYMSGMDALTQFVDSW